MDARAKKALFIAAAIVVPGGLVVGGLIWFRRRKNVVAESAASLRKWEGAFNHLYLDTKGLPTTGIGNLVKTSGSAVRLPWQIDGRPATNIEIASDFAAVSKAKPSMAAHHYAPLTKIRLSDKHVQQLAEDRLHREFVPALRSRFTNFDKLPRRVQLALLDMIYSLGPGAFDHYNTLKHAIERKDYKTAALASMRHGAREERNQYVQDLLMSA